MEHHDIEHLEIERRFRDPDSRPLRERWAKETSPARYVTKTIHTKEKDDGPSLSEDVFTYWVEEGTDEDLEGSPGLEDFAERLDKDADKYRYPYSEPNPTPAPPGWPTPLGEDAYHGLVGEIVRRVAPYTEASEEALLVDLLASFGLMVGKGPYYKLGGSKQQPRLFIITVGDTARGRKGAARGVNERLTENVETVRSYVDGVFMGNVPWTDKHYLEGLTSGEGLAAAAEDVRDGRLLIVEEEFDRFIRSASREGSTLSHIVRMAYDKNRIRVANKNSPIDVPNTYVSFVGNITQGELMASFGGKSATETINGFGNRFLYIAVRRSRLIPETSLPNRVIERTTSELRDALKRARRIEEMTLSGPASKLWQEWYTTQREPDGLFGSMTARLDVHALRAAMVYALYDGTKTINSKHLRAAIEVIRYAEDSARYILGESTGNTHADRILRELRLPVIEGEDVRKERGRIRRTDLFDIFDRNITADELDEAVLLLTKAGLAHEVKEPTGGAPRRVIELL